LPNKPVIAVTRKLPDSVETRMRELFDARLNASDAAMDAAALKAAAAGCVVLVPTITDEIDAGIIQAGAEAGLKMIANFGAGVEHIDLKAAQAAGIVVSNTPGVLTEDTADMAMLMVLAVARRLSEGERVMRAGRFRGWAPTWMMGRSLRGKRLGVIGMGRIGQALARRARAFDMQIHYHNRKPVSAAIESALEATYWDDLGEMLARTDVISVNCPSTPATRGLLNAAMLDRIGDHAYLVNTARGDIIDEAALAERLADGRIAGAALDVYENEPEAHPTLMGLENALLVPHLGSATLESRTAMGEKVLINIKAFLDDHAPPDRVVPGGA